MGFIGQCGTSVRGMTRQSEYTGRRAPSEILRILCLCLGARQGSGTQDRLRDMLRDGVDWVGLAALGNAHLVAPALWVALETKGLLPDVPSDFRDYLAAIHRANAIRTDAMRRQACAVVAALNVCGIVPVILKGGARLFEPGPRDGYARMMADIDLLVELPRLDEALATLRHLDYEIVDVPRSRRSHATTLRRSGELAAIDLHHDIGPQRDFIPLAHAIADAVPVTLEDCRLRIPSPTHRAMHVFFHSQIHDRGHAGGVVPLRHLEEFAGIVARHAETVDWAAIDRACDRLRFRGEWDAWLYLAARCLGVVAITPVRRPRRAWLHYQRCLFQLDHGWVSAVLSAGLAATEPLSYANIDYKYGCGARRLGLFRARVAETLSLCGKYRHRIPQRLAAAIRDAGEGAS